MRQLRSAVRRVLLFHPNVVTNHGSDAAAVQKGSDGIVVRMKDAAESLVTELIRVLSLGLCRGKDLWSVLETLEEVPNKILRQEREGSPVRQTLHRLKFSSQLIYVVKSTLPHGPNALRERAVMRLMLSQGVLLASLELIARWNAARLAQLYNRPQLSVLCDGDGIQWDAFLVSCTPIGGVTLEQIEAGVPKDTLVTRFDLKLVLSDAEEAESHGDVGETVPSLSSGAAEPGGLQGKVGITSGADPLEVEVTGGAEEKQETEEEAVEEGREGPVGATTTDICASLLNSDGAADEKATKNRRGRRRKGGKLRGAICSEQGKDVVESSGAPSPGTEVSAIELLLDKAELALVAKWKLLATELEEHEALLFAEADYR
ncbi:hypothetical protein ERJ75_000428700 [Trypanosoma vivax]|uniref:Uncharacterized protein n=1 Tax=Trypanosoma vivax (strain Y486) TaxID=1055687 RepID=G0U1Q8_TRYVY|nr:hypothetical protein TRVL_05610 [Trypanosoma vivax]KAH8617004.1 hypothetical protein ERJ75_000428700 [Trypanosoma vivax]CCC50015.1 conserved hypothetical protein [Trypanosoma vivax Y486]